MGLSSIIRSSHTLSSQAIPESSGFLGIITKPLDALNAPSNALKSVIRGVQTGNISDFGNAFLSFIPGAGSEEVKAEDITGSKSFYKNLAFDIFFDPLNLVGGLGILTKAGKLGKRAKSLTNLIKVADAAGDVNKGNEFRKALALVTKEVIKSGAGKPERAIINLGLPFTKGKDIGDFNKLRKQLDKIPIDLLPNPRKIAAQKELVSVRKSFDRAVERGLDTTKIEAKISDLSDALAGYNPSVMGEKTAERLQGMKARFKYDADDDLTQATYDFTRTTIAKDIHNFKSGQVVAMIGDVEKLYQGSTISMKEGLTRLTRGAEARNIGAGKVSVDDISARFAEKILEVRERTAKGLKTVANKKDISDAERIIKTTQIMTAEGKNILKLKGIEEARKLQFDEAKKVWGVLGEDEIHFIRTYADRLDGLVAKEIELGIKIKPKDTQRALTAYVRRVLTPEARTWMAKSRQNKQGMQSIMSQLAYKMGSAHKRKLLPEFEITKVNAAMRKEHGISFDFFSTDLIESLVKRNVEHINAIHRAKGVNILAEVHGVAKQTGQSGVVSASEMFTRAGLNMPERFKNTVIPKGIMDDAFRSDKFLQNSVLNEKVVVDFLDKLEVINRPFRKWLTTPFPAFHMRNAFSNWMLNGIGGVGTYHALHTFEIGQFQWRVARILRAGKKLNAEDAARLGVLTENNIINSRNFMVELGAVESNSWAAATKNYKPFQASGRIEAQATRVMGENLTKMGHDVAQAVPNAGFLIGGFIEDNARIAHYEGKLKQGLTSIEATRSVNRYLFDYSKLTNFEKEKVKPFFLFYTWMRNNVPLMAQTAFQTPRKFAAYAKLVGIGDDELPTYLRGTSAFKNPFGGGFVGSVGAPMEDLNIINTNDVNPLFFEQLPRVFEKIVSRMSPAVRIPMELITGRTAFNRKPLRNIPLSELIVSSIPASRLVGTINKLVDPERPGTFKLIDFFSGIRTYDVSDIKAKLDTIKRKAIGTGKFRQEGFLILPKREFKEDPIVTRLKKEMAKLNKKLRKERERQRR